MISTALVLCCGNDNLLEVGDIDRLYHHDGGIRVTWTFDRQCMLYPRPYGKNNILVIALELQHLMGSRF